MRDFIVRVDGRHRDRLNYHSLPFPADGQPVALRRLERTLPMSKRDISGLTVVITGAARGIGEATAELLAGRGHSGAR